MNDQTRPGDSNQSDRSNPVPPDVYAARITGTRDTLAKLLQTFELDVGCRHPEIEPNPDRTATVLVYATKERVRELENAGYKVEVGENVSEQARRQQEEVGKGDRFEGGRDTPRGLGKKGGYGPKGGSAS